ncbi:methyltransferase domain-containing protein [Halarcobacter sp.]|uniref:class I SAM-dependent methyltransferase n=1 Tax=Halarcobacter sp. TaxID=2321133 RepID=UPI0029F4B693|nr:methyltransferase domain-containing protein [Halarcobacter sp.]
MKKFTNENLYEIIDYLTSSLKLEEKVSIEVLNPDCSLDSYCGQLIELEDTIYKYRGYKDWTDLAQKLFCKMLTPKIKSLNTIELIFKKLDTQDSFHNSKVNDKEKYGVDSKFYSINKNEQPEILLTYLNCLKNVKIEEKKRVLNLGINNGDEFMLIKQYFDSFKDTEFVGLDYCSSAIEEGKNIFKDDKNVELINFDIKEIDKLHLGKFDLIISIGTFQSSNLEFNKTFMNIVQNYLKKDGSMILGFPNSRWIDGEIIYGAKAANYSFPELSVLFKDANFCKKYLQQKKFRVTLTGQYYIFLTATSIR